MHLTLTLDDVPFEAWMKRVENTIEVEVDGTTFRFKAERTRDGVRLVDDDGATVVTVPGFGSMAIGGTVHSVAVARFEPGGGPGAHGGRHGGLGGVRTPMPGKIVKVHKAAGDTVAKGEVVVVLEAMKMQVEVKSPGDGVVTKLGVAAGDAVDASAVLFEVGAGDSPK